jgi:hypothetical protein
VFVQIILQGSLLFKVLGMGHHPILETLLGKFIEGILHIVIKFGPWLHIETVEPEDSSGKTGEFFLLLSDSAILLYLFGEGIKRLPENIIGNF